MTSIDVPGTTNSVISALTHYIIRAVGGFRFRPFETMILNVFREALPPEGSDMLRLQMERCNHVDRLRHGRAVELNWVRGLNHECISSTMRLPYRTEGLVSVASGKFSLRNGVEQLRADLCVRRGLFSWLGYDRRPGEIFGNGPLNPEDVVTSDVNVLFDPVNPHPFAVAQSRDLDALPGWLRELLKESADTEISTPLRPEERRQIIAFHDDLKFPTDYLDLASVAESIRRGAFEFNGLAGIWPYLTPSEYIVVLAEIEHGRFCLLRGGRPGLHYIDNNTHHIPVPVGPSFRAAMEKAYLEGVDEWNHMERDYC